MIQNSLNLFQCQVKARASISKAERTIHVTGTIYFDDTQASMLLMIRAKTTVVRAPPFYMRRIGQRHSAGLVKARCGDIGLGIAIDQPFKRAVLRTTFAHIHLIIA